MATFESKVYRVGVEPHPNADRLDLAVIGDFRAVIGKDYLQSGDLAAYIPEGSVVPEWVIEDLNLQGRLAGGAKNRVKATKLRGVISQGIVYPVRDGKLAGHGVVEGQDVTEILGLQKYEPPVPVQMQGQVRNAHGNTLHYDIENIKKYPGAFLDGEGVVMTEKLHGTWCCLGWDVENGPIVTSKGLSGRGLSFKLEEENNKNLYVQMWRKYEKLFHDVRLCNGFGNAPDEPFYILGEVYGRGVQDLHYGLQDPDFAVFDVYIGKPGQGFYVDAKDLWQRVLPFGSVPKLYQGPFSYDVLNEHTNGKTSYGAGHVREGVVVKPYIERTSREFGRVILKSVSDDYLMRKGGTEFN